MTHAIGQILAPPSDTAAAAGTVWRPGRADGGATWNKPGAWTAMTRGARGLCPCCGRAPVFAGWLRPASTCTSCGAPLGEVRADDAPPYFVVFIVAHLVIGLQVAAEATGAFSLAAEMAFFLPFAAVLCIGLLRPVKGATIGLMLQHGLVTPAPSA